MPVAVAIPESRASVAHRVFGVPVVLCSLLVCLTFCFCAMRFSDPDLWWHLELGKEVWQSHAIPQADHWSFTVYGKPWVAHEWLSQVLLYLVWRVGGYQGLQFWLCGMASVIVAGVYELCRRYCGNAAVATLGGSLAFFFGTIGFSIRPQLIGFALLVVELLIMERAWRGRPGLLWCLPPLFAIWVNCHGSYALGLGILFAAALCAWIAYWRTGVRHGPDMPQLARVLASCVGALLINPVGFRLLLYPLDPFLHEHTSLGFVQEWLPLTTQDVRGIGLFIVIAGLLVAGLMGWARASAFELLVLVPVLFLAIQHTRMVFVFGIICAPIVCRMVATRRQPGKSRPDYIPANVFLVLLAAFCCYVAFPGAKKIQANVVSHNPASAVEFIRRSGLQGPMMNDYMWGGYLIWALPEHKVFVDGRGDVFDWAGVLAKYRDWATVNADPARLLNEYGIQLCVLPLSAPEAQVMPHLAGWTKAYSDDVAVVFVRNH